MNHHIGLPEGKKCWKRRCRCCMVLQGCVGYCWIGQVLVYEGCRTFPKLEPPIDQDFHFCLALEGSNFDTWLVTRSLESGSLWYPFVRTYPLNSIDFTHLFHPSGSFSGAPKAYTGSTARTWTYRFEAWRLPTGDHHERYWGNHGVFLWTSWLVSTKDKGTTIWLFNIAVENHQFLIGKPSINGPFYTIFHGYVK